MLNNVLDFIVKRRVKFSFLFAIIFFVIVKPNFTSIIVGFLVSVCGECIRTWASGYIMKNKLLAKEGPYSLVRHPLYLGSFIIGIGASIMGNSEEFFLIFLGIFLLVYLRLMKKEEVDMERLFGKEFFEYRNNTPMLIPGLKSLKEIGKLFSNNFSWSLVKKHKEYNAWLGIVGSAAILLIKAYLRI